MYASSVFWAWWNSKQPNAAAAAVILSRQQQQHDPNHGYVNVGSPLKWLTSAWIFEPNWWKHHLVTSQILKTLPWLLNPEQQELQLIVQPNESGGTAHRHGGSICKHDRCVAPPNATWKTIWVMCWYDTFCEPWRLVSWPWICLVTHDLVNSKEMRRGDWPVSEMKELNASLKSKMPVMVLVPWSSRPSQWRKGQPTPHQQHHCHLTGHPLWCTTCYLCVKLLLT